MAQWKIVGGPREFTSDASLDIQIGWTYDIERGTEHRTIRVLVVASMGDDAPDDSRRAVRTNGRSAITPYLGDDDPPETLIVSALGVRPKQ